MSTAKLLMDNPAVRNQFTKKVVREYDTNEDGKMQLREIQPFAKDLCESVGLVPPPPPHVASVFKACDDGGKGFLDESQFDRFFLKLLGKIHREAADVVIEPVVDPSHRPHSLAGISALTSQVGYPASMTTLDPIHSSSEIEIMFTVQGLSESKAVPVYGKTLGDLRAAVELAFDIPPFEQKILYKLGEDFKELEGDDSVPLEEKAGLLNLKELILSLSMTSQEWKLKENHKVLPTTKRIVHVATERGYPTPSFNVSEGKALCEEKGWAGFVYEVDDNVWEGGSYHVRYFAKPFRESEAVPVDKFRHMIDESHVISQKYYDLYYLE